MGLRGPDAEVRRQRADGTWTEPFRVPRSYLASHAELDYGGNVHVAQGRTVDTAHLLITGTPSRQALYVGMTRGRQANTAHVVTGKTAPAGNKPYQQAAPESVLASVLQRDAGDRSATEQIRHAQEQSGGTGHLLHLWSAATRQTLHPDIDQQITARLTESEAWRYQREHSRQALRQRLRAAQLAGHDIGALIDQITTAPMDGARSISGVLKGRLQQLQLPGQGHEVTWSQRTPATAPEVAHELATGLDERIRELGERMIAQPQPWLLKHLGMLAPDASPALREEYARRAGIAAGYRDAAGITDPRQAVSLEPHRDNPELDVMRFSTMKALEITEDSYRSMTRGELEARILDGEHAQASAPADVSSQLRITAQAEADAWQQSADAEAAHDQPAAAAARALASQMTAEKTRLEALNATYEGWAGKSKNIREAAGKAKAELGRRGQAQPQEGPQTMAGWWRQLDADLDALDRAIGREHQAAIAAGKPWPPERTAQAENERPEAGPVAGPLHRDGALRGPGYDLPVSGPEPAEPGMQAPAPQHEPDAPSARLDVLQARADQAAQRLAADNAEREARAAYTTRIEREAQAEPEAERQAEIPDEAEMEL